MLSTRDPDKSLSPKERTQRESQLVRSFGIGPYKRFDLRLRVSIASSFDKVEVGIEPKRPFRGSSNFCTLAGVLER